MKRLILSETMFRLRAAACAIYDRGLVAGKAPEELAKEIAPLTEALKRTIADAVTNDLPGCVIAVQRLQNLAKCHREDAEYLMEKAHANIEHAELVQVAMLEHMKQLGVTELKVDDFTATIAGQGEDETLILR